MFSDDKPTTIGRIDVFQNGEGGKKERRNRERVALKGSEGQEGVRGRSPEAIALAKALGQWEGFGVFRNTSLVSGSL